jgi:hypothetical protein
MPADERYYTPNKNLKRYVLFSQVLSSKRPEVLVSAETEKEIKIPEKITLTASKIVKDEDTAKLNLRWVITAIPETANAKSQAYVLYQKLSNSEIAQFQPDLAGVWTLTLEADDGYQPLPGASKTDPGAVTISVNAIRHILWLQHSDKDIALELYTPDANTSPKTLYGDAYGPYYLEVAQEKVGIYQNYNDDGMPVDKDNSISASGRYFSLERGKISNPFLTGAYDGKFGSTDFRKDQALQSAYRHADGAFSLKSASNWHGEFPIVVRVHSPKITELVLPTKGCAFGQKGKLIGTYHIKQWIDYWSWYNLCGSGFSEYYDANKIPDWLEKRAAEALNSFPQVLPYVLKMAINDIDNRDYAGGYYMRGTKIINLNPYDFPKFRLSMRYNSSIVNKRGFWSRLAVDSVARHEAHHVFWWWNIYAPGTLNDNDGDRLPNTQAGGMFRYLWDNKANYYAACGPRENKAQNRINVIEDYYGDSEPDEAIGCLPIKLIEDKSKVLNDYKEKISEDGYVDLVIDLLRELPVSEVYIKTMMITASGQPFVPCLDSDMYDPGGRHARVDNDNDRGGRHDVEAGIARVGNNDYVGKLLDKFTRAPKLLVTLNNRLKLLEIIDKLERMGAKGELHIFYKFRGAQPLHELDASLAQVDAMYTGDFEEVR